MTTRIKLISCLALFAFGAGYAWMTNSSAINTVRGGTLNGHESTTIARAFEATFEHCNWRSFTGPKGEVVVEFTGTLTGKALNEGYIDIPEPETCGSEFKEWKRESHNYPPARATMAEETEHRNKVEALHSRLVECEQSTPIPITFQFLISAANPDNFSINAVTLAGQPFSSIPLLKMIYQ